MRDCETCGNSRKDQYGRDVPFNHKRCNECQGRWNNFAGNKVESKWYPKGTILIEDEREA